MPRTFTKKSGGYEGVKWPNLRAGRRPLRSCPKHGPELVGQFTMVCFGCHIDQLVASGFYSTEVGEQKKADAIEMLAAVQDAR